MHKEDIIKNAKFYDHFLNKQPVYLKGQNESMPEGPFYIEDIKIYWLDIPKTRYDIHYVLSHKAEKRTVIGKESDIIEHVYEEEKCGIFNKIPKYSVNDIVLIEQGISHHVLSGHVHYVVGVIKEVHNHRDTGEVFYHIIFNSGTPRKTFEREIETKFSTNKFWRGHEICKQLLAKMYHTHPYDYISEKDFMAWVYANFEERKEAKNTGDELLRLSKECIKYDRERPEFLPEYRNIPIELEQSLNKVHDDMISSLLYSVPTFYMTKDEFKLPTKEEIKKMINKEFGVSGTYTWNLYKKIIFSGPCTIILWTDGTKTIAKASSDEEVFDPEKGVAICFMKKMLGHTETNKILRKASEQYEEYIAENRPNSSLDEFIEYLSSLKSKTKSVDQSTIDEVKKVEEEQQDDN